jgi:hypothetical protein
MAHFVFKCNKEDYLFFNKCAPDSIYPDCRFFGSPSLSQLAPDSITGAPLGPFSYLTSLEELYVPFTCSYMQVYACLYFIIFKLCLPAKSSVMAVLGCNGLRCVINIILSLPAKFYNSLFQAYEYVCAGIFPATL